jgi:hypothetical protein
MKGECRLTTATVDHNGMSFCRVRPALALKAVPHRNVETPGVGEPSSAGAIRWNSAGMSGG